MLFFPKFFLGHFAPPPRSAAPTPWPWVPCPSMQAHRTFINCPHFSLSASSKLFSRNMGAQTLRMPSKSTTAERLSSIARSSPMLLRMPCEHTDLRSHFLFPYLYMPTPYLQKITIVKDDPFLQTDLECLCLEVFSFIITLGF